MNEMKQLMTELTDRLRQTNEYNQYINVLSRLKQDPELYERIGDYRRRSLWIQMQEGEAFIQGNNGLQKDFADLQENGLANEFFAAEHQSPTSFCPSGCCAGAISLIYPAKNSVRISAAACFASGICNQVQLRINCCTFSCPRYLAS